MAVGALLALATFATGVVVGRQSDGDGERAERAVDTTHEASDSRPPRTTSVEGADTTPARTTSPASTTPPEPGPPVPFTSVDQAIFPADVASLRSTLDVLGFPAWWPMPDAIAPPSAPFPTVQEIVASDRIANPGRTDAAANSEVRSTWLVDSADVAAAEALIVPKIPADIFDIQAGLTGKDTKIENGATEVSYFFSYLDESSFDSLYLVIRDGIVEETGERVGSTLRLSLSDSDYDRPSPIPTGAAPAKQFLGVAPSSPELVWNSTEVAAFGGLGHGYIDDPSIRYKATWNVQADDFDAVIAFLSDPGNFTGDLKLVSTGVFVTDESWRQPMGYQGLIGQYSALKPDPGGDGYVYLEFAVE